MKVASCIECKIINIRQFERKKTHLVARAQKAVYSHQKQKARKNERNNKNSKKQHHSLCVRLNFPLSLNYLHR